MYHMTVKNVQEPQVDYSLFAGDDISVLSDRTFEVFGEFCP